MSSPFEGKTIVLTGKFVTMKRAEAKKVLKEAGATVTGSISGKTDILVHGENAGSKLSKAKSLGTELMTEQELVAILTSSEVAGDVLEGAQEKLAEAAAAEEEAMREVTETIAAANAPYLEEFGATPGQLLASYLRVFRERPDVFVFDEKMGAPANNEDLRNLHGRVPPEFLALSAELGPLEFNWVFEEMKEERDDYSKGYNGGRVALAGPRNFRWHPIPGWQKEHENFEADAMFDDFVAEGTARLSYDPGQAPSEAELIFDDANNCARYPLGGVYDYLRTGARAGFSWYWQNGGEGEFTEPLLQASLPASTAPEEVLSLLEAKGLDANEAAALAKWLGDEAVILLHASETEEGERLMELANTFPLANESSSRSMELELVESLAKSSDPLSDEEWSRIVAAHVDFLETGGAGGTWQILSVSGLPMCIYMGEGERGEQVVMRLKNIGGVDGSKALLEFADLSGTYAAEANFEGARLSGSVLIDGIWDRAKFDSAVLRNVDFSGARLEGASFRDADLSGADFESADLTGADFTGANLEGARFPGATLDAVTPPKG